MRILSGKLIRDVRKRDTGVRPCPFSVLLVLLIAVSCAGYYNVHVPEPPDIIKNVPFYPREEYQCGPASLAGVLGYYGSTDSPDDVARDIFSRSARGTLGMDLASYAGKRDFRVSQYHGSLQDIRDNILHSQPLILLVDSGFWVLQKNHFMVVIGASGDGVIVNSGKEQHKYLSNADLLRIWRRTGFWTLLITPRKHV